MSVSKFRKADSMSRMCLSKKRFSQKTANKIAQKFNQRAYCCTLCFNWHLTSSLEKKGKTL